MYVSADDSSLTLVFFIIGTLLGLTGYSIYTAFGAEVVELRDPFKEHEN